MKFEDLELDSAIVESLRTQDYESLYPPQEDALPIALSGKNLVLAVPTASGKSLVAYLALVSSVMRGGKAVYIVPLRALAAEKYEDLKRFEGLGVKVCLSIGDYDSADLDLERYDIVVATSEKIDSLLRHRTRWLHEVTVVVADEVHLLNDPARGPTLEVTLTKFRMINPKAQIIALSATIMNSRQMAEWLDAAHVTSDWRPVPLKEGVYLDGNVFFADSSTRSIEDLGDPVKNLVNDCLSGGGQVLIFVNTRRASESLARSLRPIVRRHIDGGRELKTLSKDVSLDGEEPTSIGRRLSECVRSGVAFHNAALANAQRRMVEESFRDGRIKCIVATPTLAAGINLPARMVIIRDAARYEADYGHSPIPVLEIKQMCGRAGRPRYDEFGEAIFIARDEDHRSFLLENYILSEPEEIYSKLGTESALRSHVLAAVATGNVRTEEEISEFLEHSFLAVQTDTAYLDDTVNKIMLFLEENEMILRDAQDGVRATLFGRRVSDLYVDPASAVILRRALEAFRENAEFGVLHALTSTVDLQPLYLRQSDYEWVEDLLEEKRSELLLEVPADLTQYEFFLAEIKTASLICDWIDERTEEEMEKKFGIGPGDIRNKTEIAEWMAYSMDQLSAIFRPDAHETLGRTVKRISHGIRNELLELVKLKNIGRVRARILFNGGLETIEGIRSAGVNDLARLPGIGQTLAIRIKEELGQKREIRAAEMEESGQRKLSEFQ